MIVDISGVFFLRVMYDWDGVEWMGLLYRFFEMRAINEMLNATTMTLNRYVKRNTFFSSFSFAPRIYTIFYAKVSCVSLKPRTQSLLQLLSCCCWFLFDKIVQHKPILIVLLTFGCRRTKPE